MYNFELESDIYEFGKNQYYPKGSVVVWRGDDPAIVRITKEGGHEDTFGVICIDSGLGDYDSMSIINLRPATEKEIELLGSDDIVLHGKSDIIRSVEDLKEGMVVELSDNKCIVTKDE